MVENSPIAMPDLARDFYEESIKDEIEYIRFIGEENKVLQRIRESHQGEWQIVESCREIMFDNAKEVNSILGEIENVRSKIKELG